MFSTTDELNTKFRYEVRDKLEGLDDGSEPDSENLWKEDEIYSYMTEAADAVARGLKSLYKIIELPVVEDEIVVKLPSHVLDIRFARLLSRNVEVKLTSQADLTRGCVVRDYGVWLNGGFLRARGTPQYMCRDRERKALVLAPTPTVDDTLEIQCAVTLSTPLMCGMPLPFFELPDQRLMLHYMKYLAYAKPDADTLDLQKSESFLAKFNNDVVDRESEVRRERRLPEPIAMEGW